MRKELRYVGLNTELSGREVSTILWIEDRNKKPRPEQYQFRSIGTDTAPAGVDPCSYFILCRLILYDQQKLYQIF